MKPITKAVFPVAGLGTRFLPATKSTPKEMLPIVDKPLIQYAVEEAIAAGITEMIFVTSSSKRAIEDHFDTNFELEYRLANERKAELLEIVRNVVPKGVDCIYVRQPQALGLGHAVLCARQVVGDNPFAVLLADDLITASENCLTEMVNRHALHGASVIAVEEIPQQHCEKYGIVSVAGNFAQEGPIDGIVEKPKPADAPSNLAVIGRYILNPGIFGHLAQIGAGRGGEIQLTDAIARLLRQERVVAWRFAGKRHDCGSKLGYMQASIELGLRHPELGPEFRAYLTRLLGENAPLNKTRETADILQ